MIRITHFVENRIDELADYYVANNRYEALIYLRQNLIDARTGIEGNPNSFVKYPGNYYRLEDLGLRWRKFHRYWFGWTIAEGYPIVTNFDFETNNIPGRILTGGLV